MKKILYGTAIAAIIVSCDASKKVTESANNKPSKDDINVTDNNPQKNMETIDPTYLDRSIRPQDDFFMFSNGTWVKENPVPPSESRWGSFNELDQANKKKLTKILEEFQNGTYHKGEFQQILGDYYNAYLDMEKRNELGIHAIEKELTYVNGINSKNSIPSAIAYLHNQGIGSLFRFGVRQDMKNVDGHIASFSQGGIGLPNKEYYTDESKKDILEKYTDFIAKMSMLQEKQRAGHEEIAKRVVDFETRLANQMMTRAELRVPENTYNLMSREDAINKAGTFDFDAYLRDTGIESFDTLVVGQPDFLTNLSVMMEEVSLEEWKDYLNWCVLNHYAGHLNQKFVEENFNFYGKVLSGKSEMKPINERAISEITGMDIGELLGKAFVGRYFSELAQQRVNDMVDNLLLVFGERINQLEWMSDETKTQANNKLDAIGRKLGFPHKWEDYSSIKISRESYIDNINSCAVYSRKKNLEKLYKPVDKDEWGMPAHMVNAYYHPLLNEIVFPAGIMQPPFFSEKYEDAVNYGRMGMVIGHEFTHGFDDMGSKFAADGSFNNWWTEEDRKAFEERTGILGETFSNFCPFEGQCVNPALTMGENIADLGGLTLAYNAYKRTDEFKSGIEREGFTPGQRFFIAYAQLWKINYTDEELKNRLVNDPHSPGMYRVNGPLMNCPEFFKEFNVQESDPMRNSTEKCANIW